MTPIVAVGRYGSIEFDGTFVTIKRTGMGRLLTGSGEKRFHIRNIASINFKPATTFFQGRIEFTIPGSAERRGRPGSRSRLASEDENAMLFLKKSTKQFKALKDAVYAAQAAQL